MRSRTSDRTPLIAAVFGVVVLLTLWARPAAAQDGGAIGVDAGVPAPLARDAAVPAPLARDAAVPDARIVPDAGVPDAAAPDARARRPRAAPDAAVPPDAAIPPDAGVLPDAAVPDAAVPMRLPPEMIPPDAGPPPDAAVEVEAAIIEPPPPPPPSNEQKAWVVIKLVVGLVALMVLAYLGSHRRVVRLQERLGIGGVIAAGFPFVALGLIMRQPEIGVLTPAVIERLQPLLHFGLGWLGFIIGAQLDIRVLDKVPSGTAYLIIVESLAPFALTAAACGGAMIALGGASWDDNTFWRDVILLGVAAAMTAPRRFRGFANRTWREGRGVDHLLAQLDEIVGVIGMLFIAAYFRPDIATGWQLPGTAWVFVSIGLGVVIGVLIFAMVRAPRSNEEFLAVVLGSIAFGSGLAGFFFLSPIAVCFVAGALVTNFPSDQRESIFKILNHLERPIHLLFLIIVGATWNVFDWRAWALVPLFVLARVIGKWTGIFAAKSTVGADLPMGYADTRTLVTPVSALAIALVISVHGVDGTLFGLLSGDPVESRLVWITTVVLGGAILTEILVSLTGAPRPARRLTSPGIPLMETPPIATAPLDELDDHAHDDDEDERGPIYDPDTEEHPVPPMIPRPPTRSGSDDQGGGA